jgi:hypothetical protein
MSWRSHLWWCARVFGEMLMVVGLLTVLYLVLLPDPACAATSKVSKNIGNELKSWGTALLFAVAALVAIPVLARRDVSGGLVLTGLVVLVGGFVYAAPTVVAVIKGIWRSIAV